MDPDVLKVLTSHTEKQLSCSPSHARHVFSGDWVWSFTASIVFALTYVHPVFSGGWILVIHCFCPLVHTIFTTANIRFLKHLAPLLLMTTHCFHRKALWPHRTWLTATSRSHLYSPAVLFRAEVSIPLPQVCVLEYFTPVSTYLSIYNRLSFINHG